MCHQQISRLIKDKMSQHSQVCVEVDCLYYGHLLCLLPFTHRSHVSAKLVRFFNVCDTHALPLTPYFIVTFRRYSAQPWCSRSKLVCVWVLHRYVYVLQELYVPLTLSVSIVLRSLPTRRSVEGTLAGSWTEGPRPVDD